MEYEIYRDKNIAAIRDHLRFESFEYREGSRSYTGGKVICIHCGKEFTWKDWGKYKTKALTMAMKHLYNRHILSYLVFNPYIFRDQNIFNMAFPEAK